MLEMMLMERKSGTEEEAEANECQDLSCLEPVRTFVKIKHQFVAEAIYISTATEARIELYRIQ
jgi:hypothetical protein